jgi:phage terminase small subunit
MTLNPKQKRFVDEYVVDHNATQAAIRAGYSAATAYSQGQRLLKHVEVAAEIAKRRQKLTEKLEITAERVAEELAKIGFANMADYMRSNSDGDPYLDFSELTRDQAAALAEVTIEDFKDGRGKDARDVRRVKFKLHDKHAALVDLGKHLGMFKAAGDSPENPIHVADVSDQRRLAALALMAARAVKADAGDGST